MGFEDVRKPIPIYVGMSYLTNFYQVKDEFAIEFDWTHSLWYQQKKW